MPQQLDLVTPDLEVRPQDGSIGPRLWVRRLAVWSEPGGGVLRDVALRPGLNIVWSPDAADQVNFGSANAAMGHGGGKTLFCRLLRYCLGENRFASEDQRERISVALPNGIVGAEVMLDGKSWAIVRPLGARRRHVAIPEGNLADVVAGEGASTGLDPFVDAIEQSILTSALADLIPGHRHGQRSWQIALAFLTRDQECRFDHVLDWRSSTSESDSPARGFNTTEKLDALRAFLQAITPDEQSKRTAIAKLDEERRQLEQEVGHLRWEMQRAQDRLSSALDTTAESLTDSPMATAMLRTSAQERLAAAMELATNDVPTDIKIARTQYEGARAEVDRLNQLTSALDAEIPLIDRLIRQIQGEFPGLSYSQREAENAVCPICEVPIERALAEGCGLSNKLPDLEACRKRWEKGQHDLVEECGRMSHAKSERVRAQQELALAGQEAERLLNRLQALEKMRDMRESAWYAARRLVDDVERFGDLSDQKEATTKRLQELTRRIESERDRLGAIRSRQARVFGLLNEKFDPIIRWLLGPDAQGHAALTGNGLELAVSMGGDRSTAAIDSLKVIAFDLAVLCLSIEGATRLPAFLVHDSPREADLGLSLYHRLFHLGRSLERVGGQARFQYVVTTTTHPPADLATSPWTRLTLRGAPAAERLLRYDL